MKRKEEILKVAEQKAYEPTKLMSSLVPNKVMSAYEIGFIEGAEWADKTMIDNACNWLEEELPRYVFEGRENKPYISVAMIDDFKATMKGGEE